MSFFVKLGCDYLFAVTIATDRHGLRDMILSLEIWTLLNDRYYQISKGSY